MNELQIIQYFIFNLLISLTILKNNLELKKRYNYNNNNNNNNRLELIYYE